MSSDTSYQKITDRIIELLEQGVVPWRKPWSGGPAGHPKNMSSGKKYRGINVFMLHVAGYESPWWLTYKQAKQRGGHVGKGEHGWPVVFWNWIDRKTDKLDEHGQPIVGKVPFLRVYTAFNVAQCDGIDAPGAPVTYDHDPIESAQAIVGQIKSAPNIRTAQGRAAYCPASDVVSMPSLERFKQAEDFYSVLFHELTHWTGHTSRLDRFKNGQAAAFGSNTYGREELVAELGAAFLNGEAGIVDQTVETSAAYIDGWLKKIRKDVKLVVTAAAQAQKATDFILDRKYDTQGGEA